MENNETSKGAPEAPETPPAAAPKTSFQKWKSRVESEVRLKVEKEGARAIAAKFFAAPVLLFAVIAVLYFMLEFSMFMLIVGFMMLYIFAPIGKESLIPLGISAGIDPLTIGFALAFPDIIDAMFLMWNYDFAKLAPLLGPWMDKFEKGGARALAKRKWLKPASVAGLMLFGIIPVRGTGGCGSTVIGRFIGLEPRTIFIAITARSIIGTFLLAYFFELFKIILGGEIFRWFAIGVFAFFMAWWGYDYYKDFREERSQQRG